MGDPISSAIHWNQAYRREFNLGLIIYNLLYVTFTIQIFDIQAIELSQNKTYLASNE